MLPLQVTFILSFLVTYTKFITPSVNAMFPNSGAWHITEVASTVPTAGIDISLSILSLISLSSLHKTSICALADLIFSSK
jgi:hypothetical protein